MRIPLAPPFPYFRVYSHFEFHILYHFGIGDSKGLISPRRKAVTKDVWRHPHPSHFSGSVSELAGSRDNLSSTSRDLAFADEALAPIPWKAQNGSWTPNPAATMLQFDNNLVTINSPFLPPSLVLNRSMYTLVQVLGEMSLAVPYKANHAHTIGAIHLAPRCLSTRNVKTCLCQENRSTPCS